MQSLMPETGFLAAGRAAMRCDIQEWARNISS
jgi:hypothetical protein